MANLKEIKNRIKSVKDVQQITRAMKMVAAAKLRKFEAVFVKAREGYAKRKELLDFMYARNSWVKTSLFKVRDEYAPKGYILLSGDKGLCGGFNVNVTKKALSSLKEAGKTPVVMGVGKKGNLHLKREGYELTYEKEGVFGQVNFDHAIEIAGVLIEKFKNGEISELNIVYNRFKAKGDEQAVTERLLPFSPEIDEEKDYYENEDYLYDNGEEEAIESFSLHCFVLRIYLYLLESESAEFLARMTAMDSASDNATDLIASLTLDYNRARQAAITTEIIDIVGGAEALK